MMGGEGFRCKACDAIFCSSDGKAAMLGTKTLYDEDFVLWSKRQAEALRAAARGATNQPIDWENVAEEIDSLGRSDRRELSSQIRRVIEHLLKLENSRASDPRAGWIASIEDARSEIEVLLGDSPSLKTGVGEMIATETKRAARKAISALREYGELNEAVLVRIQTMAPYTEDQVLGDWFPPQPEREPRAQEP
jgi:Domain of unknown function DUF29